MGPGAAGGLGRQRRIAAHREVLTLLAEHAREPGLLLGQFFLARLEVRLDAVELVAAQLEVLGVEVELSCQLLSRFSSEAMAASRSISSASRVTQA